MKQDDFAKLKTQFGESPDALLQIAETMEKSRKFAQTMFVMMLSVMGIVLAFALFA